MKPLTLVLTGPECTGKTTLARGLAQVRGGALVEEFAREYFARNPHAGYSERDVVAIATEQARREDLAAEDARLLVVDTDDIVIAIWSQYRFGQIDDSVLARLLSRYRDPRRFYLLTGCEVPWAPDPLRENPVDRDQLFELYVDALVRYGCRFCVFSGSAESRLARAAQWVDSLQASFVGN